MTRLTRSLVALGAWLLVLTGAPPVRADSVSPYHRSDLRALVQSADIVVVAQVASVVAGQRGGLVGGRMVPTTDTHAHATVASVVVGDASLRGRAIDVLFTAADDPIEAGATDPLLLFLVREGAAYRLCFAELYGAIAVHDGHVQIWLEGTARGTTPTLASLTQPISEWAAERVRVASTATVAGADIRVRYQFTNDGPRRIRIVPPSWVFDAVWANEVRPGTNDRTGPDWAGVGHWEHLHARERMRALRPGRTTTFEYRIPRATLQMQAPGEYLVGLRYQPFRASSWSPAHDDGRYPADTFVGAPPETTVRLATPR